MRVFLQSSDGDGVILAKEEVMTAKRVSILTYEGDRWEGDLVQRRLLTALSEKGVLAATVVNCVAGYTKEQGLTTRSLVDGGGLLPVKVEFIASEEQLQGLLPAIRKMVGRRTLTITEVEIDSPPHAL
jgi:PII-like signaling protein